MDFSGLNRFNVVVNALSGNFLPLNEKKMSIGSVATLYVIFTWLIEIAYILTATIGLVFFSPILKSIQDGGITLAVATELLALTVHMNSQRKYLRNLVSKINGILVRSGELRKCIRTATKPHMGRMKICIIMGVSSITMWTAVPIVKVFYSKSFTYDDFAVPAYLVEAPFDVKIFVVGIIIQTMACSYLFLKKTAIDVYVSYFVTILTGEYQYVGQQLTETLRQEHDEQNEISVIEDLRKCVQHHSTVIETGQMLCKLLSVNICVIYMCCVLRFCFLAFNLITIDDPFMKCLYVIYAAGSFVQVFMLCSCVQELLEASTSITDNAFYENWYGRGPRVKNIFRTIGLGNEIECRLTAFRVIDLTVPTFVSMLNQAYSVCLLMLRVR